MSCTIPAGHKTRQGYSTASYEGKTKLAHRVAYCEAHGLHLSEINGQVVRHTCDNPPCVNPEHLLLGSQAENVQDCVERGRRASRVGTLNGRSKLSPQLVEEIRSRYAQGGITQTDLSKQYGISNQLVSQIVNFKVWSV